LIKVKRMPKVSVCVIVYNQSNYILECLQSIIAQQCSFEFEVVIRDDASTDGSGDIIADYILKNRLSHFTLHRAEKNEGMMPNLSKAFQLCRGDYIAFCEADDYWTDDLKLEKQVSLMQNNPDCTFSVHPCYLHKTKNDKNSVGYFKGKEVNRFSPKEILTNTGQTSPSASYMLRSDVVDYLPSWFSSAPIGDFFIEMYSSNLGYGLYMPEVMCAYRVFSQGSWSDQMRRNGGSKMINHGVEMQRCIRNMESDSAFSEFDFSLLKSGIMSVVASGHLLEKDFDKFKDSISESYGIYPASTKTQSLLYRLKNVPVLAYYLYKSKGLLYNILKYK
jgi:glycosyltransferase involved in cell wall biosynthesis